MTSTLRRLLLTGGVIVLLLVLAGATYQGVSTALERRRFPYPGRMIDVGGHQLHLHCDGKGAPTVVLEAPETAMSSAWAWVQGDLIRVTRVCSYDRAGLGWSETGDMPYAPEAVPTQLHVLLMRGGERTPYVMAGAELGAAFASIYASRFPDDVAALVLVNPPGPYRVDTTPRATGFLTISPWLARIGVLRATRTLTKSADGLPEPAAGALGAFLDRPDHLTRAAAEFSRWDATVAMANDSRLEQTLPVTQVEVEVEGNDRIGVIANRRNARDVATAIARAVARVRAGR